jgi:hypothetical protein
MRQSHYADSLAFARSALRAGDVEATLQQTSAVFRAFSTPPFPLPLAGGISELDCLLAALGAMLGARLDLLAPREHCGNWALGTFLFIDWRTRPSSAILPRRCRGLKPVRWPVDRRT